MGQYVRRELARRLGVSASFLSQFELGQSQAAVNVLEGTHTVIIKGRRKRVKAGNAVAMRGDDVPHRLVNETDELVRAIWFVTD